MERFLFVLTRGMVEFIVVDDNRLEVIPLCESVSSLNGMVPKPKAALSLEDMERAIREGAFS